jgi:cytochrome c oxidase subunit 4
MTLAEYRKGKAEELHDGAGGGHAHPSAVEYIQIGAVLAVITAAEVGLYYIDMSHNLLVVLLLALSAVKFSLVILWFMHLKFDNWLFSQSSPAVFPALTIFVVALSTLHGKLIKGFDPAAWRGGGLGGFRQHRRVRGSTGIFTQMSFSSCHFPVRLLAAVNNLRPRLRRGT